MTEEDVRNYETKMQAETNEKVLGGVQREDVEVAREAEDEDEEDAPGSSNTKEFDKSASNPNSAAGGKKNLEKSPVTPTLPVSGGGLKSWFTWN